MSFDQERLTHENPPSPDQLQTLAAIGIRSAVSRNRFKTIQRDNNIHYFIEELDLMGESSLEDETPTQIRHRMAVRVGARPPQHKIDKTWSLKFFNTFFVEAVPGEWKGERSTYRFEWTRGKVLMADRVLRLVGFNTPYEETIDNDLEHFRIRDDDAAILSVSEELRMVNADDCDDLIRDMADYFRVVDATTNR